MGLIESLLLLIIHFFSFFFSLSLNIHSLFAEAGKGLKISIYPRNKSHKGTALTA